MNLYLMRHGHAVSDTFDPERPLSANGRLEVERMAFFLKSKQFQCDRIWCSVKLRAIQTAEIVAETLGIKNRIEIQEGFKPNDPVEPVSDRIQALAVEGHVKNILLVAHVPFLSSLAASLAGGPLINDPIKFEEAGIAALTFSGGLWSVPWKMAPDSLDGNTAP